MPPDQRPIPRFIAEPPQEGTPYGRWEETLAERFLAACEEVEWEDGPVGEPGRIDWFPSRTLGGRTYVPATAPTSEGLEVFGFVSFLRAEDESSAASEFESRADVTDETAANNPDWQIDLSDQELGPWRGPANRRGVITLAWGEAMVRGAVLATAELGPTTTDQCEVDGGRFTLVSLDSYTGDYLEVRLWGNDGRELAAESLYEDE